MNFKEIRLMLEQLSIYYQLLDKPFIKQEQLKKEINFILDTLKKIAQ